MVLRAHYRSKQSAANRLAKDNQNQELVFMAFSKMIALDSRKCEIKFG
jgi:hypothetical protein